MKEQNEERTREITAEDRAINSSNWTILAYSARIGSGMIDPGTAMSFIQAVRANKQWALFGIPRGSKNTLQLV